MIKTPQFWYEKNLLSKLKSFSLIPLSYIWIFLYKIKNLIIRPYNSKLKVICIGNLTSGGTGKTPFAIYSYKLLQNLGFNPVFLTRGYGGILKGPTIVQSYHEPNEVGDEAILLSKVGTTVVSKNRDIGAKFIEKINDNHDIIIMDDGLQNNQLAKDLKVLLIDKILLFGNKYCIPAGPLRETVNNGLKKIDVIILTGNNNDKIELMLKGYEHIPIFNSIIKIKSPLVKKQDQFLAFCGLANPEKFFKTLKDNKFNIIQKKTFPDHYAYTDIQIESLITEAITKKLKLITTEKDYVKINFHKNKINFLPIQIEINIRDKYKFESLIKEKLGD